MLGWFPSIKFSQFLFIWEWLNFSSFLKDSFTRYRILIGSLFLLILWLYHSTAFLPPWLLRRSHLLIISRMHCTRWVIFLLLLSRISFCLCLSTVLLWFVEVWISFSLFYFEFVEFLECWLMFVIKFGKLSAITSSNVLYLFSLSPFLLGLILSTCWCTWWWSQVSKGLLIFLLFYFYFSIWIILVVLSSLSLTFSSIASNMLLISSTKFFISVIFLLKSRIFIWFFFNICLLTFCI